MKLEKYERQLEPMLLELNNLARWLATTGKRIVVLLEGRDTAGKGGTIAAITSKLNPRQVRVVALPSQTSASARSGTSSSTSRTCRRPVNWCCSIAVRTTGPAWRR